MAYEVKFDLGGQRLSFEKVAQFNIEHGWKSLMKISRIVYESEHFQDFKLASEVKFDLGGEKVAQFNREHGL